MKNFVCSSAVALFLVVLQIASAPPVAALCFYDLHLGVPSCRIHSERSDPDGDLPDVYLELRLFVDLPCSVPRVVRTLTREQSAGSHPLEGLFLYYFRLSDTGTPLRMEWNLWDDDGTEPRDLMAGGSAYARPGSSEGYYTSRSGDATIALQSPWPGWTPERPYPPHMHSRWLPPGATTSSSIVVYLDVYGGGGLVDSVDVFEDLPPGFTFESATPAPTAVTPLSGNGPGEGDLGTRLRWGFPDWSSSRTIEYHVTTPASVEQLKGQFGSEVRAYDETNSVASATGLLPEQVAIGGILRDCDGNGQDDWLERIADGARDCNREGTIDACEIAAGLAADCDGDGILDACEIASGASFDGDLDGIPDECEPTTGVDFTAAPPGAWIEARPNPAAGGTMVVFGNPGRGMVTVRVFDAAGRHVVTLADEERAGGVHSIRWDGRDASGRSVAPGIYLFSLELPGGARIGRAALLR